MKKSKNRSCVVQQLVQFFTKKFYIKSKMLLKILGFLFFCQIYLCSGCYNISLVRKTYKKQDVKGLLTIVESSNEKFEDRSEAVDYIGDILLKYAESENLYDNHDSKIRNCVDALRNIIENIRPWEPDLNGRAVKKILDWCGKNKGFIRDNKNTLANLCIKLALDNYDYESLKPVSVKLDSTNTKIIANLLQELDNLERSMVLIHLLASAETYDVSVISPKKMSESLKNHLAIHSSSLKSSIEIESLQVFGWPLIQTTAEFSFCTSIKGKGIFNHVDPPKYVMKRYDFLKALWLVALLKRPDYIPRYNQQDLCEALKNGEFCLAGVIARLLLKKYPYSKWEKCNEFFLRKEMKISRIFRGSYTSKVFDVGMSGIYPYTYRNYIYETSGSIMYEDVTVPFDEFEEIFRKQMKNVNLESSWHIEEY